MGKSSREDRPEQLLSLPLEPTRQILDQQQPTWANLLEQHCSEQEAQYTQAI